jgi:serine phosphatase RsbU (regulator of sigma subunit)/anti-sigma regulatory factor (Ser/Thr protein kinase)
LGTIGEYKGEEMTVFTRALRRVVPRRGREGAVEERAVASAGAAVSEVSEAPPVEIAPNDPLIAYFQSASGAVDVDSLELDSPGVEALKAAGVKLVVPLVSQGELIGVLNLGQRLSDREYSGDDRKLLDRLAAQAAPALRVGQLVQEQEAQARSTERIAQEMRVAQLIQQQFLPRELPELKSWEVEAHYQPAREVGGDFYDFFELPGGRVGLVVGDVTDKGVPAALVMATTRSILRTEAPRLISPGKVLERANELLVPDIPAQMFVTCLFAVLDPETGKLQYANAGHNLPCVQKDGGSVELRARGMPLGLMSGMAYEEKEAHLGPSECVLLYSDGLVEAHSPTKEMFGFPKLLELVAAGGDGKELIDRLLAELSEFTGEEWDQEDDITLVTLQKAGGTSEGNSSAGEPSASVREPSVMAEFSVSSEPGNELKAIEALQQAVGQLDIDTARLERLKTAVGEATMNAIEHGNKNQPDLDVEIRVLRSDERVIVQVSDHGGDQPVPTAVAPDLEAKLAGEQSPRGWGLFLIKNMVDDMEVISDGSRHTVELTLRLKGEGDAN